VQLTAPGGMGHNHTSTASGVAYSVVQDNSPYGAAFCAWIFLWTLRSSAESQKRSIDAALYGRMARRKRLSWLLHT
jgi:hypothetical protein